jgi:hypothetical protein
MTIAQAAPPADAPEHRPGTPRRLAYLYEQHLVKTDREDRFLIWVAFTTTFAVVRFITHSIRDDRFTHIFHNVQGKGGKHIHHLVFGIFGLLIGGFVMAGRHPQNSWLRRGLAVGYGSSAALTIDEFALWLNLEDVYWAKQGRESVDAAIVTAALMGASTEGWGLFRAMGRDTVRLWRRATGRHHGQAGSAR